MSLTKALSKEIVSDVESSAEESSSSKSSTGASSSSSAAEASKKRKRSAITNESSTQKQKPHKRQQVESRRSSSSGSSADEHESVRSENEGSAGVEDAAESSLASQSESDEDAPATPTAKDASSKSLDQRQKALKALSNGNSNSKASEPMQTPPDSRSASPSPPPIVTYKPPHGFEKAPQRDSTNDTLKRLLNAGHLDGKEIWHIRAPANMDFSTVKFATPGKYRDNDLVISTGGVDYTVQAMAGKEAGLLLPGNGGTSYARAASSITHTCAIKRSNRAENAAGAIEDESTTALTATKLKAKAKQVPSQPPGLRIRFWPAGSEGDQIPKADVALKMTEGGADSTTLNEEQLTEVTKVDKSKHSDRREKKKDRKSSGHKSSSKTPEEKQKSSSAA